MHNNSMFHFKCRTLKDGTQLHDQTTQELKKTKISGPRAGLRRTFGICFLLHVILILWKLTDIKIVLF